MVYDALHKRKVFLDAFGEGLEEFGIWSLIRTFPDVMKPAFVATEESIEASDVLAILKPLHDVDGCDQERVWEFLTSFIRKSPEKGMHAKM